MAIVFPSSPALGDVYPPNPGVSGTGQWEWDGSKWNSILSTVSLGTANQGAYNDYQWPSTPGVSGTQLTSDGSGGLAWGSASASTIQMLTLDRLFNGSDTDYTLIKSSTGTPFTPDPPTNLVVFLGGVPQIPLSAYTVSGSTISFSAPPPFGTTFYGISNTAT